MLNTGNPAEVKIGEEVFSFLSERAIWRPDHRQLIIADLHVGKATHFRKNGLPAGNQYLQQDLMRLERLMDHFPVKELIVLGDLFHSTENEEHDYFEHWLSHFSDIRWILTQGNHDKHSDHGTQAKLQHLEICHTMSLHGIRCAHFNEAGDGFLFHGHEHPVYTIKGRGSLKYTGPCFVLKPSEKRCILPAFGSLTGGKKIKKNHADDQIFLIADKQVIKC